MRSAAGARAYGVLVGVLLMGGLSSPLAAQTDGDAESGFWITGGLGGAIWTGGQAFASGDEAIALVGQLSYQAGHHLFSLRGGAAAELFSDGLLEVGLLYGRARPGAPRHGSISAGLAWVYTERCGGLFASAPCRSESTLGVPIVAEASFRAAFIGIGAQAFANINPTQSLVGIAVVLHLGDLD